MRYFYPKAHSDKRFMLAYRLAAIAVIFLGSQFKADLAWNIADLIMGFMALMNIPVCVILGKRVYKALWDYMIQRNSGREPTFDPEVVLGTAKGMECWTSQKS